MYHNLDTLRMLKVNIIDFGTCHIIMVNSMTLDWK